MTDTQQAKSDREALLARLEQAEARVKELARDAVSSWEALPGGRNYSPRDVEAWLIEVMKPCIDRMRAALKEPKP